MSVKSTARNIEIKVLRLSKEVKLPEYQTEHSSGLDLRSIDSYCLEINSIKFISTGLILEIPEGYEGQVRSRSGLASKGIIVPNSPGTIDSDYRGEIKVMLANIGNANFIIEKGDRIAQIIICATIRVKLLEAKELTKTARQGGGFGSTGTK